jgi:ribosomal protein S18 acetylase RimI-like enzyme
MDDSDVPVTIRSFRSSDLPACRVLYREGLLGGKLAENDTGLDIDDIESAYMKPGNHFWVAETTEGEVVGMIGVHHHDEGAGEIRRLRVRQDMRRKGIGTKLMEAAVRFCHDHQYLKVTLDTFVDREPAIRLFNKFRFHHSRTRNVSGKDLMYFYLDLYTGEHQRRQQPEQGRQHGQA